MPYKAASIWVRSISSHFGEEHKCKWHARGQRFETVILHHLKPSSRKRLRDYRLRETVATLWSRDLGCSVAAVSRDQILRMASPPRTSGVYSSSFRVPGVTR
jgi:hypothetical protein